MDQRVFDDPVFKQRLGFRESVDEDGAPVALVEMWVQPGGAVPAHTHPLTEERFEVLSGTPSFLAGKQWQTATAGETVVVPAGVRHAYRNRGSDVAHVMCTVRPPSLVEEFLGDAAALARAGMLTRYGLPTSFSALLRAAVMVHRSRETTLLGFPPMPPPWLQRLVIPPLARLGERRGYRPGHFAQELGV